MKAGTVRSIIKSLQGGRLDAFLSQVGSLSDGKRLLKICRFIHASTDYSEAEVIRECGISRGTYLHALGTIGEALILFINKDGKVAFLGQCVDFARSLIAALDYEAATDLLRSGMREAAAIEEFDYIQRFWKIADSIDPSPDLGELTAEKADNLQENLKGYERLLRLYQRVRGIPNVLEKRTAMKELIRHPLLKSEGTALSHRATYYFLKVKSAILAHLRQYGLALRFQTDLVAHLQAHPWISEIEGLALVQELGYLARYHYLTGDHEQYHRMAQQIHDLSFKNPRVEIQRIRFLYPVRIGIAIEAGSDSETAASINSFLAIREPWGALMGSHLLTRNLYTCFYGAIAMGSPELRRTLNRLLSRHRKSDFEPQYYTMYRLLEVINAIEDLDWDDARRLITNRTKRPEEEVVPKAAEAFRFLAYLITVMEPLSSSRQFNLPAELHQLLAALIHGSIFSDYFDLEVWVQSRERGCSMLSIFKNRASTSPGAA